MSDTESEIRAEIAAKLGISETVLGDDMTMEELGFDSLTAAEVLAAVEKRVNKRIDMSIVAEKLTRDTSIQQLIGFILEELDAN
jgi:acyl carrier protein